MFRKHVNKSVAVGVDCSEVGIQKCRHDRGPGECAYGKKSEMCCSMLQETFFEVQKESELPYAAHLHSQSRPHRR